MCFLFPCTLLLVPKSVPAAYSTLIAKSTKCLACHLFALTAQLRTARRCRSHILMICISPPFAAIQVNLSVPERSGLRHSILANRHFGTRRTPKQSPSLAVEHHRLELAVVVSRPPFRGGQRDAIGHRVLVHYRDGLCRAHAPAAQRLLDVVRPARRWARGWPAGGRRGRGRAKRTVAFLRLRIRVCRSHHRFIKVRANGDEGRAELTWTPRLLYASCISRLGFRRYYDSTLCTTLPQVVRSSSLYLAPHRRQLARHVTRDIRSLRRTRVAPRLIKTPQDLHRPPYKTRPPQTFCSLAPLTASDAPLLLPLMISTW